MRLLGSKAFPRGQIELPAVQRARQYAVFFFSEARQVGLQVRTASLHHVITTFPELPYRRRLGVVGLGVLQALRREDLEEVVDVLVVRPPAFCLKAAREEETVNPILLVVQDLVLDQRRVYTEAVIILFVAVLVHPPLLEVQNYLLSSEVEQHPSVD